MADYKKISVLVQDRKQFNEVYNSSYVNRIYIELSDDFINNSYYFIDLCNKTSIELFLALPYVNCEDCKDFEVNGYLIRTYGQFQRLGKCGKKIIIDKTLNSFNHLTVNYWLLHGADSVTLSNELALSEINICATADCEIVCYGYMPNMVTVYCPFRLYSSCTKKEDPLKNNYFLMDQNNNKFYVMINCKFCYSLILNCNAIFVLHQFKEIKDSIPQNLRLEFTNESPSLINTILNSYGNAFCGDPADHSIINAINFYDKKGFTRGHFFKSIK